MTPPDLHFFLPLRVILIDLVYWVDPGAEFDAYMKCLGGLGEKGAVNYLSLNDSICWVDSSDEFDACVKCLGVLGEDSSSS